ncbi:MAG: hypothetical protein OXT09_30140 [Myxococcales bacterium]|nr:hypothetical protein [Myxococcales bacterium]
MSKWIGLGTTGWLALLLAGSLVLVACSDDSSDDGDSDDVMDAGGDGDTTGDGDGDTTGDGDGDTSTDTGIPCGPTVCADPTAGLPLPFPLPGPCCADDVAGTCGMMMNGECAVPPPNHDTCPPLVTGFGIDGTSCCIEDSNECGLIDTLMGTGDCVSLTDVNDQLGGLTMGLIPIPSPVDCDGNPIAIGDGDGGGDDAGQ